MDKVLTANHFLNEPKCPHRDRTALGISHQVNVIVLGSIFRVLEEFSDCIVHSVDIKGLLLEHQIGMHPV